MKENLRMRIRKVPGFRRRRTKDEETLLDEALRQQMLKKKISKM